MPGAYLRATQRPAVACSKKSNQKRATSRQTPCTARGTMRDSRCPSNNHATEGQIIVFLALGGQGAFLLEKVFHEHADLTARRSEKFSPSLESNYDRTIRGWSIYGYALFRPSISHNYIRRVTETDAL